MVGTTLTEIRDHVEALASDGGAFYLVCARTGERPIPAAGERFDCRATARSAARATEQYRTALRRYDPRLPYYDIVACEDASFVAADRAPDRPRLGGDTRSGDPRAPARTPGEDSNRPERRRLIEFCHRVAGAVFETLSDGGYATVETAVMDAYFDLAETVPDPDDCCLCLLESMAAELDTHLTPAEQTDVLASAVARVTPVDSSRDPVTATFDRLQRLGLLGGVASSPPSTDSDAVVVRLSEYALSPRDGRLPLLPVAFDLFRHGIDPDRFGLRVATAGDGWRLTLTLTGETDPNGVASVPIRSGG